MSLPVPSTSGNSLSPEQMQALDAPLVALTNTCGGDLRRLMFAYFSFLHRRTDFYLVPHEDDVEAGSYMGFREGDAEKLLLAAFRQFPLRKVPKGGLSQGKKSKPQSPKPPKPASTASTTKKSPPKVEESKDPAVASADAKTDATTSKDDKDDKTVKKGNMAGVQYNEEGLQIPVGNGGSTPNYKWTQTIDECSVLIGVPDGLRGKDLDICLTPSSLSVKSKKPLEGQDKPHAFVEGKLSEKIRSTESTWSMEGGVVIVTLDKFNKTFWSTVIEGDEKIDTEQVDSRRHVGEYDDATQGHIRKVIFDQGQYHNGGPTSDEILGKKPDVPQIPQMPPGVEYIDQKNLDQAEKNKAAANAGDKEKPGEKQKYTINLDKK
jgi:HSP20 family molecular chaperone IbpA